MDINTDDTFTPPVLIQGGDKFDTSLSGTFVGTVTLQRSKDGLTNWLDVETFTGPAEKTGEAGTAWFYRVGIKAGDYTSGTAVAAIY